MVLTLFVFSGVVARLAKVWVFVVILGGSELGILVVL